jgi:CRP-like cAMP-binding protein
MGIRLYAGGEVVRKKRTTKEIVPEPEEKVRRCADCAMRLHGVLRDVPLPTFSRISCIMTPYRFPAGHLLFIEGNPATRLASIRKGLVKLSKTTARDRTQIVGSLGSGALLGYEIFEQQPCQSTAETLTEAEICMTTLESLEQQVRQFPDVALGLIRSLSHRVGELEETTLALGAMPARQRLASHLLAATPPEASNGRRGATRVHLTRQDIAESLGMARETLIRLLTKLADEGIVALDGSLIAIRDRPGLERILGTAG